MEASKRAKKKIEKKNMDYEYELCGFGLNVNPGVCVMERYTG